MILREELARRLGFVFRKTAGWQEPEVHWGDRGGSDYAMTDVMEAVKRRARLVPKRRPDVKALDQLCRELVWLRDRGRCVGCGSPNRLEWAHVHTRRCHSMRWNLDNSMTLCRGCHVWWHQRPMEAAAWWEKTYPERMKRLTGKPEKPDLENIRAGLEAALERFARTGDMRATPTAGVSVTRVAGVLEASPAKGTTR